MGDIKMRQHLQSDEYNEWKKANKHDLERIFMATLAPEDQPKTDDTDEWEEVIERYYEAFEDFCMEEYKDDANAGLFETKQR